MKGRVLVVDDDLALAEMLGIVLRNEGLDVVHVADGTSALPTFLETRPDVVLLDVMLPGMDGMEVCRRIRAESGVPIVMLTARTDTVDVVVGLESGADDYVVKPFKPQELVARIRARLRRGEDPEPERLTIGDLTIDVAGHSVKRGEQALGLTPLEFDLLVALARKPWQVFSREVLLEQVWGYRHAGDTRLVNVHVQRLRSKRALTFANLDLLNQVAPAQRNRWWRHLPVALLLLSLVLLVVALLLIGMSLLSSLTGAKQITTQEGLDLLSGSTVETVKIVDGEQRVVERVVHAGRNAVGRGGGGGGKAHRSNADAGRGPAWDQTLDVLASGGIRSRSRA